MDGIAPLRQIDPAATHASMRLFAPAPAIRARVGRFTGTPLPKDEPIASNPPTGAPIDYVLTKPAKTVELSIFDAHDAFVRRYSSHDPSPNLDPGKTEYAPEWVPRPPRLATTPGHHRFVWPLRYAQPAALADNDTEVDGIWVAPGRYMIELAVDGKKLRQPLMVVPDPRISLDDDAYAQQLAYARDVQAVQIRVAAAQEEAKTLHKALIAERMGAASNPELASAIDAFDADVVAHAGFVDAGNPRNAWALPPTTTTSLRFISETLGKLAAAANGADTAPTPDARAGYDAAVVLADKALGDWSALTSKPLAALNAALKAAHRKPVSTTPPKP
jgi:hypothetical protein